VLGTDTPRQARLIVRHDLGDESAHLVLRGELDVLTAPRLEDALALIERRSAPIAIDLRDLLLIDTSGLRVLAGARRRASEEGRPFAIIGCRPSVTRVFELTGMLDVLGEGVPERLEAHTRG